MNRSTYIITQNPSYKQASPLKATGIVVHSTGCDQKKISAYRWQFDRPELQASVHGCLGLDDKGELCYEQWLPYGIKCWGVGRGKNGTLNVSHIQFEICEHKGDWDWCRRTYNAALQICHELCLQFGIDPDNVVSHKEAYKMGCGSNHADPEHWWDDYGLNMATFREELKDQMFNTDENYGVFKQMMQRYEEEQRGLAASQYAEDACRKGVKSGIFTDGTGDGSIDYPQAYVKRQELAVIMERKGLL